MDLALAGSGVALALAAWLWPSHAQGNGKVNPADYADARFVAVRWAGPNGPFPKVPVNLVLAIMKEESRYKSGSQDHTERAEKRGGAYGLMGMTAATSADIAPKVAKRAYVGTIVPYVARALEKYRNLGAQALLDPNVNVLFGVFYLNELGEKFGHDNQAVIAAYHEGASRVAKDEAGPRTRQYVANVLTWRKELEGKA